MFTLFRADIDENGNFNNANDKRLTNDIPHVKQIKERIELNRLCWSHFISKCTVKYNCNGDCRSDDLAEDQNLSEDEEELDESDDGDNDECKCEDESDEVETDEEDDEEKIKNNNITEKNIENKDAISKKYENFS